jgi:hypothetical protein
MENYNCGISGWLKASGETLLDTLPAGSGIYRIVPVEPDTYRTGYVSTGEGSFKLPGTDGNWYGTCFGVSLAEKNPAAMPIYEYSRLCGDTAIWNMNNLPEPFLTAIHNDKDLLSGRFRKSQFVVECLQALSLCKHASGIYFPSRWAAGGVVVLNPQVISIEIIYTGQSPPPGLI